MLKIKGVSISELYSIDKDTGSLSLFNIFHVVSAPAFPVVLNKLTVAISLEREPSDKLDGNVEFVVKQNDEIEFSQVLPFLFGEDICITNLIVKLNSFIIKKPGKIEFIAKCDDALTTNSITAVRIGTKL
jgi:hypothetical protein